MKYKILTYRHLLLILSISCISCSKNPNRIYFSINTDCRKIVIPVQLNDSITANLAFDTGWYNQTIFLDSSFVAKHPDLTFNASPEKPLVGTAWETSPEETSLDYKTPQIVKIGNTKLTFNAVNVLNWKRLMRSNTSEGIFNIPPNDTVHVWELNFENNYLEIHSAENFKIPNNCFLVPMKNRYQVYLPMHVKCADGDTITLSSPLFFIDTGMPFDIALMYRAKELDFFQKRDDAVWTAYKESYFRSHTVNAKILDKIDADSLRVYTFDHPNKLFCDYLIGVNFLKRFNVFFDLKNKKLGLQPIKNFQRIVDPVFHRFHYSTHETPEGRFFVKKVGDYAKNYYKTAGLRENDELIAVDGKPYKNVTFKEKREFYKKDTLIFDIIRGGKPLKIIVPVDKNEKQGD